MGELIKSKTHCPTCGSEVKVGTGDGNSHYYIPINKSELTPVEKLKWDQVDQILKQECQKEMHVWRHNEFRNDTHPRLYRAIVQTAILFCRQELIKKDENRQSAGVLVDNKFYTHQEYSELKCLPENTIVQPLYFE